MFRAGAFPVLGGIVAWTYRGLSARLSVCGQTPRLFLVWGLLYTELCAQDRSWMLLLLSYKHRKVDIAGHGASLAIFKWLFFKQLSNNFL